MAIQNQQGITSYSRTQGRPPKGTPAEARPVYARAMLNPLEEQTNNVDVTVNGAGAYNIVITEPDGTVHTVTFTAAAETVAQIRDGLVTAFAAVAGLRGVATAAAGAGDSLDITFDHEGIDYTLSVNAAVGTLVLTETQAAGGINMPIARMVIGGGAAPDGQQIAALPTGATVDADLLGPVMRPMGSFANDGSPLSSDDDFVPPGNMLDVAREGGVEMENVGGAAAPDGLVHVVINTAGGNELGEIRGDADGGNTIVMAKNRAYWVEAVAGGATGPVFFRT